MKLDQGADNANGMKCTIKPVATLHLHVPDSSSRHMQMRPGQNKLITNHAAAPLTALCNSRSSHYMIPDSFEESALISLALFGKPEPAKQHS